MNSKKIATVSNGYTVTKLSIAVVVNQQRLAAILGANATPEQIAARVAEIQKLVASATGFTEARGDVINVSAVEFIDGLDGEPIEEPGMLASVGQHAGTMINAGAFIVVVFLLAFFGLKPMVAALGPRPAHRRAELRGGAALAARSGSRQFGGQCRGRGGGTSRRTPGLDAARRSAPEDPPGSAGPAGAHGRPQ